MTKRKQLREKEFLEQLASYAQAQRDLIAAECSGFSTDAAARDLRVTRAQNDFRFFCRTYFPHYLKSPDESEFHRWLFDNIVKLIDHPTGQYIDLSAPRGEAKTTIGGKLLPIWLVLTERKHFMPLLSASWDQSAAFLEAIKTELSDNPRLAMDYPGKAGRGRVWQTGVIVTANNRKLQAYGRGKRIRGISHGPYRPDFVLIDDLEDPTAIATPEQRDKTEKYVSDEVLPLGPPDGSMDVLWNNTIAHYDSAANRFHKKRRWVRRKFQAILKWPHRMDLWEQWEELYLAEAGMEGEGQGDEAVPYSDSPNATDAAKSPAMAFYLQHRDDMDRGALVSWPSVRPLIKLMMIRASGHRSFDSEYQNDPSNDKEAPFSGMKFWVHADAQWLFHGVLDPSLGKMHRKGDPAAILVGGFRRDITRLSIVEAVVSRMRPELQLEKLIAFHAEYRCLVWGVEDTAFQEYFRQQIVTQSAARGMPVPAIGIRNEGDKDLLIESVSPHVSNGLILFNQRHSVFNSQVRHWPEADHDDGPDALQMLWRLCLKRAGGVPSMRLGKATRA